MLKASMPALVISLARINQAQIAQVVRLLSRSELKRRQAAPILPLRARAFGSDRKCRSLPTKG